jgi:hypothetical protein
MSTDKSVAQMGTDIGWLWRSGRGGQRAVIALLLQERVAWLCALQA